MADVPGARAASPGRAAAERTAWIGGSDVAVARGTRKEKRAHGQSVACPFADARRRCARCARAPHACGMSPRGAPCRPVLAARPAKLGTFHVTSAASAKRLSVNSRASPATPREPGGTQVGASGAPSTGRATAERADHRSRAGPLLPCLRADGSSVVTPLHRNAFAACAHPRGTLDTAGPARPAVPRDRRIVLFERLARSQRARADLRPLKDQLTLSSPPAGRSTPPAQSAPP